MSHTFTEESFGIPHERQPDTTCPPSGVRTTLLTQSRCPRRVDFLVPVSKSQTSNVKSSDAEIPRRPSREMATAFTQSVWPRRNCRPVPSSKSHETKYIPLFSL